MTGGELPDEWVLVRVYAACNAEDVRPDTDYLTVKKPVAVSYSLDVTFWIDEDDASTASLIEAACNKAVNDWVLWQKLKLGRDINPSELTHRLVNAGAKRAEIRSPSFTVLKDWQVAYCTGMNIVYGGLEKA